MDNVLNKLLDPVFIGFAAKNNYDVAIKSCTKRDAKEPVGVIVKKNGKYDIIEYSEISDADAHAIDPVSNELKYKFANILILLYSTVKLLELSNNGESINKLYHKAHKKVSYYDFNEN